MSYVFFKKQAAVCTACFFNFFISFFIDTKNVGL